ncbi:MAG: hypothetical protein K1Y36_05425 [Blastocatellia bacterium]|nr:hypothetical protein [Blastocatellia bacterium]
MKIRATYLLLATLLGCFANYVLVFETNLYQQAEGDILKFPNSKVDDEPSAVSIEPRSRFLFGSSNQNYELTWTQQDLAVWKRDDQTVVFSAKEKEEGVYQGVTDCGCQIQVQPLSFVGSYLSYSRFAGCDCKVQAHPSADFEFNVVDVSQPERTVVLTEFFSETDLFEALIRDKLVRKTLGKANSKKSPTNLQDLLKILSVTEDECDYQFDQEMLSHFGFYGVENGQVLVRIGLEPACELSRGQLTQIGLRLPLPKKLRSDLQKAEAGQNGFLMREIKYRYKNTVTVFSFGDMSL